MVALLFADQYSRYFYTIDDARYTGISLSVVTVLYIVALYAVSLAYASSDEWTPMRLARTVLSCCCPGWVTVTVGVAVVFGSVNGALYATVGDWWEPYAFANVAVVAIALEVNAIPVFAGASSPSVRLVFPSRVLPCPVFQIDVVSGVVGHQIS